MKFAVNISIEVFENGHRVLDAESLSMGAALRMISRALRNGVSYPGYSAESAQADYAAHDARIAQLVAEADMPATVYRGKASK